MKVMHLNQMISGVVLVLWLIGCGPSNSGVGDLLQGQIAVTEAANGEERKVAVGTVIEIRMSEPGTVSPEYQYHWQDPTVTGDAVVYRERVSMDDHPMPGSRGQFKLLFKAVKPGSAEIVVHRTFGSKAGSGDFKLQVKVN